MPMPRFIQLSTLTSYPASLLNRDDSGLAKRMPFGGGLRTRVSSQCLKRHWRLADDAYALENVDPALNNSVRSRALFRLMLHEPLVAEGVAPDVAEAVLLVLAKELYSSKETKETKESKEGDDAAATAKSPLDRKEVVVLGRPEIAYLTDVARGICQEAGSDAKAAKKAAEKLVKEKDFKANFRALVCGAGLDAALFGRFISGDPAARVSAAVHVAHAFTVHAEASETDYFTAVDDLLTATEGGSGHLGATELTSGLFYTYVVVDVPLLVSNLTGAEATQWLEQDRALAGRVVRHLVHLIATVTPGAKLGSTAPYDHASLVLAELGERQPRTLGNAFLDPLRTTEPDLFGRTVEAMGKYLTEMDGMYGAHESRFLAKRSSLPTVPGATTVSLPELAERLDAAVVAGEVEPTLVEEA